MEVIVVKRSNEKDLRFTGEVLAYASPRYYGAGQSQTGWTELLLYKTKTGQYVIEIEKITLWAGETNRYSAAVCDTAAEVVMYLEDNASCWYWLIKELLRSAVKKDESFAPFLYDDLDDLIPDNEDDLPDLVFANNVNNDD